MTTDTPSDAPATPGQGDAQPSGPAIRVLNQYIKDLSFENPGASIQTQPNVDLGIDVGATVRDETQGIYEVTLKLNARAGTQDTAIFLIELVYGGLFQLRGFSAADREAVLLIECPRMLFPFARRVVADMTAEGGFPPLRIDPVDFPALYRQQKARQQQPVGEGANPPPTNT